MVEHLPSIREALVPSPTQKGYAGCQVNLYVIWDCSLSRQGESHHCLLAPSIVEVVEYVMGTLNTRLRIRFSETAREVHESYMASHVALGISSLLLPGTACLGLAEQGSPGSYVQILARD